MLNQVILQGRLTAAPEVRRTGGGTSVVSFRVACDRPFKSQSGERQADFIACVAWRSTAEFISRYFGKGDMILLEGRLQCREYTDQSGARRYVTEVVTDNVHFCGGRNTSGGYGTPAAPDAPPHAQEFVELDEDDGELPF